MMIIRHPSTPSPVILSMMAIMAVMVMMTLSYVVDGASMDLSNYKVTWDQDFTKMSSLPANPYLIGNNASWICHTAWNGDWNNFENPSGPYSPFYLDDQGLTIRVQRKPDGKLYSGLLSAVDSKGNGFAQKWGYFEMKAKLPPGVGTWPAFWLGDQSSRLKPDEDGSVEIDILEQYGAYPGIMFTTLHWWDAKGNASKNWGLENKASLCSMTNGFHTYGLDLQPDWLTFYYDRQEVWRYQTKFPVQGSNATYDRSFYPIIDNAYGGGGDQNNDTSIVVGDPRDMVVQYVRVWQGTGGSNNNDTKFASSVTFPTSGLKLYNGQSVDLAGVSLTVTNTGDLQVVTSLSGGTILWSAGQKAQCSAPQSCFASFQNDGNFLLVGPDGKPYWGTSTWNDNDGTLLFQNVKPYLEIYGAGQWTQMCPLLWASGQ